MTGRQLFPPRKFVALLFLIFTGLVLTLCFCDTIIIDELEHLRASRFVSQGQIPYRDFFEHHHPLLWFFFSPFFAFLPYSNITALYAAKTLACCFSLAGMLMLFKIAGRFFGGTFGAVMTLAVYFFYFTTWYSFSIFKPDTFARFFYLLGLYYFLLWCESERAKNLVICGVFFTIAFFFLQTIAFSILPLVFPLLYLLYRQPRKIKDVFLAALIPLFLLVAAVFAMCKADILNTYFELNWIYNRYLFGIFYDGTPTVILKYALLMITAAVLLIWLYISGKATFYVHVLAVLSACELLQHLIFPAIYPHYLVLLFVFCALVCGYALSFCRNTKVLTAVFTVLLIDTLLNFGFIAVTNNQVSHKYLREYDKNPAAGIVNFDVTYFSVFAPQYSYYWFYPNLEYVDNRLFNRLPEYDINRIIRDRRPEYIAYNPRIKQKFNFSQTAGNFKLPEIAGQHTLQTELLRDYEEILPNLYKRRTGY